MTRVKRLNDRIISDLHELIRQGIPWNVDHKFRPDVGLGELRGLVTGHFFFTKLCQERGDKETKKNCTTQLKMSLCQRMHIIGPACVLGLGGSGMRRSYVARWVVIASMRVTAMSVTALTVLSRTCPSRSKHILEGLQWATEISTRTNTRIWNG